MEWKSLEEPVAHVVSTTAFFYPQLRPLSKVISDPFSEGQRTNFYLLKIFSMTDLNPQTQEFPRPTVFYDGGCPMCSREIAHYKRLDHNHRLRWVDITSDRESLAIHGLDLETAMQRLHVLDTRGRWQTGAWGFAEMWAHLPRYSWLSKFLRLTAILPLLDRAYSLFARWRANRRCVDQCQSNQQTRR